MWVKGNCPLGTSPVLRFFIIPSTGSKTAPDLDATTTKFNICYSVSLLIEDKQLHLGHVWPLDLLPEDFFICPCTQLQTLVELEDVDFGAGASFLVCSLLVHSGVNLAVFHQLSVHGRSVTWWFLGCYWPSFSSQLRVTIWVFFQRSGLIPGEQLKLFSHRKRSVKKNPRKPNSAVTFMSARGLRGFVNTFGNGVGLKELQMS